MLNGKQQGNTTEHHGLVCTETKTIDCFENVFCNQDICPQENTEKVVGRMYLGVKVMLQQFHKNTSKPENNNKTLNRMVGRKRRLVNKISASDREDVVRSTVRSSCEGKPEPNIVAVLARLVHPG